MQILDLLFNWTDALRYGMDVVAYLIMALVGTVFLPLRLLIALFFGADSALDGDLADVGRGDASFRMFSLLSILAFLMAAGWMGLACRIDWGLSVIVSAATATGFGLVLMLTASALTAFARKR